ncbi:MAG: glycosyltransferase family 39 protein, partial [Bryobacteraceae bacterium]
MTSSFWLDETGTFLLVQGTFSEMLAKCARWVGQPTYFIALVWPFAKLPGPQEVVLRLPSFIGLSCAAVFVYRIGKRLLGNEAAGSAALIFAALSAYYASDARPYALGLMAVSGAVLMLIRWLDSGRLVDAIGYAFFAALTVYFHFLFSVMFLVHGAYLVLQMARGRK